MLTNVAVVVLQPLSNRLTSPQLEPQRVALLRDDAVKDVTAASQAC